jgi:alpha-tubulin suppressor-like RCC1 family protein
MKFYAVVAVVALGMYACISDDTPVVPRTRPTDSGTTVDAGKSELTASNILAIAPGRFTSCVVTKENALWCVGRTQNAELARTVSPTDKACVGEMGASATAVWESMPTVGLVDKVAIGRRSMCALRGGAIRCWGGNDLGELGHAAGSAGDVRCGSESCNPAATELSNLPSGVTFSDLSAGSNHFCALAISGDVYCWGSNEYGQVGIGDNFGSALPTKVSLPNTAGAGKLATGSSISCAALKPTGLACWGYNKRGSAGLGSDGIATGSACGSNANRCLSVPTAVLGAENLLVEELDSNEAATCFKSKQALHCFGDGYLRTLGTDRDGGGFPMTNSPLPIPNPSSVSLGQYGGLAFSGSNVFTWGFNARGATASGLPTIDDAGTLYALLPEARSSLEKANLAALAFDGTGMALRGGALLGWGLNECGQLAHPPGAGDDVCASGVPCRALPVNLLP